MFLQDLLLFVTCWMHAALDIVVVCLLYGGGGPIHIL